MNRDRTITLTEMSVSDNRIDFMFDASDDMKRYFRPSRHFFAQYDCDISRVPRGVLVIPFLCNVMQIAWLADATVNIDECDGEFILSLGRLRDAYRVMYPDRSLGGSLNVKTVQSNDVKFDRTAQLYTGGMDATTTFIRHHEEKPLLIQEYGFYDENKFKGTAYCDDVRSERNFRSDIDAAQRFAALHGTGTAFIRANYGTFIDVDEVNSLCHDMRGESFWHGIHHAMAILGAAAPAAYAHEAGTIYIASSFSVGNTYPCASDPTTDNEFRFAGTHVIHDGYELKDADKARILTEYQKNAGKQLPLRVCSWNDANCCKCEKCLRRMLQLNAEGGDPSKFGFSMTQSLAETTKDFLYTDIQFFTQKNISKWKTIIRRTEKNYDNLFDRQVADYLRTYDFENEKKRGLIRYYRKNFFSILKRKVKGLFGK